jgi:valyl-tRNA synthetase
VEIRDADLADEDRWILSRLLRTIAATGANMEKRRLNDAAYEVFDFFRHEFCDWYLEAIKPRMRNDAQRGAALCVAVLNLAVSYKLLHPVMPFITEELWSWLPPAEGYLMTSSFPGHSGEIPFAREHDLFEEVKEITGTVRNVRNELGVPPGKRGTAILRVHEQAELERLRGCADLVALLAKMEEVQVVLGGEDPSPAGVGVAGTVEIFLPMKGLVDLDKERARLQKELGKLEGWIKGCRAKLGNSKFVDNAPEHVVRQQRDLLTENEGKAAKLQERLDALDS